MLSYVKTILTKVSFDKGLFEKELSKAVQKLTSNDLADLRNWCYTHYNEYTDVLEKFFSNF